MLIAIPMAYVAMFLGIYFLSGLLNSLKEMVVQFVPELWSETILNFRKLIGKSDED